MMEKQNQVLQNLNATPVREVFPASTQKSFCATPQIREMHLVSEK